MSGKNYFFVFFSLVLLFLGQDVWAVTLKKSKSNPPTIKEDVEKFIIEHCQTETNLFGDLPTITFLGKVDITPYQRDIEQKVKQPFFRKHIFVWKILDSENGEVQRYAILDNVLGKIRPITFLVLLDTKGVIIKTAVIRYREDYGGAVQNKYWLKQFWQKSALSGFVFKKDIDNISGATISAKSLTKGFQKIILLFPFLKEELVKK